MANFENVETVNSHSIKVIVIARSYVERSLAMGFISHLSSSSFSTQSVISAVRRDFERRRHILEHPLSSQLKVLFSLSFFLRFHPRRCGIWIIWPPACLLSHWPSRGASPNYGLPSRTEEYYMLPELKPRTPFMATEHRFAHFYSWPSSEFSLHPDKPYVTCSIGFCNGNNMLLFMYYVSHSNPTMKRRHSLLLYQLSNG